MYVALIDLALFAAKSIIIFLIILSVLLVFFALLAKGKKVAKDKLSIKNLNQKYDENRDLMLAETLTKKDYKAHTKQAKKLAKSEAKHDAKVKHVYVINFHGDVKATAVNALAEEVTAILTVATPEDEVVVKIESPGGVVHGYGLAAAQLMRIKARRIPLTVCIDKVAASGGYMMASIANQILAAPFAIVGSIGVIMQLPNFHRLLKDKHIDFEQFTAGDYKRTVTIFGENTETGRKKLQHEIEEIHQHFKQLVLDNRPNIDIKKVATGEHWLGLQALELKLVDGIQTSDDYLMAASEHAKIYEICYETKKSLLGKLFGSVEQSSLYQKTKIAHLASNSENFA